MRNLIVCMILAFAAIAMQRVPACSAPSDETIVEGVVLGPDGQPLGGVDIDAVYLSHRAKDHPLAGSTVANIAGHSQLNSDGSFRMKIRRMDASKDIALELFAYAKGFGIRFQFLEGAQDKYQVTLKLPKETTVTGKLKDSDGDPLANAYLSLSCLRSTADGADNAYPFHYPPTDFSAWPKQARTGQDGSFSVRGASSTTELALELNDERAARQRWTVAVGADTPQALILQAAPPRKVEGTVVTAGSNEPIAGAFVRLTSSENNQFLGQEFAKTDEKGRFVVACYNGSQLRIQVTATGTKHHKLNREILWVDGTTTQGMTLPMDHDGFDRLDGTTADGQPASRIETEHPQVEVTYLRPSKKLTTPLSGTLFLQGMMIAEGSDTLTMGLFAVNPRSGRCWNIAKDVMSFRASPNGKYIATNSAMDRLQIVASDPTAHAMHVSTEMRTGGYRVSSWTPSSETLILSTAAPKKRHYYGEEYWQLDRDKWQFNIADNELNKLALPARYDVWDVSPDGRLLVMHWDTHAHLTGAQLYVSYRDGSGLRPLARKREQYYWNPRFSPDGKTVLAKHLDARKHREATETGHVCIRTIALDGSRECSIEVNEGFMPKTACWSPDGDHIAVVAYPVAAFSGDRKVSKIFVVDSEGSHVIEVALKHVSQIQLSDIEWSPVEL